MTPQARWRQAGYTDRQVANAIGAGSNYDRFKRWGGGQEPMPEKHQARLERFLSAPPPPRFKERLRALRISKKLTQTGLAHRLGYRESTIQGLESGQYLFYTDRDGWSNAEQLLEKVEAMAPPVEGEYGYMSFAEVYRRYPDYVQYYPTPEPMDTPTL